MLTETQVERYPTDFLRAPAPSEEQPRWAVPQSPQLEPSYYDVPMLKKPTWRNEIAIYFFLGGVSAGAYLLARMAERFGGERYRRVTRLGTAIAALAALPCAPLLIADLGDRKRFHHMLRVFKPSSPMNLGAWTLTAYSGAVAAAVLREWLRGPRTDEERSRAAQVTDGVLLVVSDVAGVPLALLLAGYTGVLLSGTATPVWSKNSWLGAMFSAGAMSNGTSAVNLALQAFSDPAKVQEQHETLEKIQSLGHTAEALTLAGFAIAAGELAKPLTHGKVSLPFWGAAVGLGVAEIVKRLPLEGRAKRAAGMVSSLVGLASGFAIRWSIVQAGAISGADPHAARVVSQPRASSALERS